MGKNYFSIYAWSFMERLGPSCISLIGNIILARLLSPDDFGLIAMIALLNAIAFSFADSGLPDALLREKEIIEKDYNTVFIYNVISGLIIMLLFFTISTYVSDFFERKELINIIRIDGIIILISSLAISQQTKLRKEYKNKLLAKINLAAIIISISCSTIYAYWGGDYWALILQQFLFSSLICVFILSTTNWSFKMEFDKKKFRKFFLFGSNLLIVYIITNIGKNINSVILGKFFPLKTVGYYSQALKFKDIPINITESGLIGTSYVVITNSKQPIESGIYIFKIYVFLILSLISFLFIEADNLILMLYGIKWAESIPFFRLLLIIAAFSTISAFITTLLKTKNRTGVIRNISIIEILGTIAISLLLYPYGVITLLTGNIFLSFIILLVNITFAHFFRIISFFQIFRTIFYTIIFLSFTVITTYSATYIPFNKHILTLSAGCIIFVISIILTGEISKYNIYVQLKQIISSSIFHKNKN